MGYYIVGSEDELYHYGRKGMKWGQNIFGKEARTARKRKRTLKKARVEKAKQKKAAEERRKDFEAGKIRVKDMSNDELREYKTKLELQKSVLDLKRDVNGKTVTAGKQFLGDFVTKAVKPGIEEAAKQLVRDKLVDAGKKALGLSGKDADKAFDALKKEVETLELNKRKTVVEDFYANRAKKNSQQSGKKSKQNQSNEKTETRDERNARAAEEARNAFKNNSDIIDADFTEVRSSPATQTGRDFMNAVLALPAPEEKK